MIISAKLIRKPQIKRKCECYRCNGGKVIKGEQIRLFGSAEIGDKPYVIYVCVESIKDSPDIQESLCRSCVLGGAVCLKAQELNRFPFCYASNKSPIPIDVLPF